MDYDATGMTTRPGYEFKGWADTADADTANYPAGSEARLDNNGSNDLYAVWEAIDVDYKVEFYYQDANGNYPDNAKDENIVTRQGGPTPPSLSPPRTRPIRKTASTSMTAMRQMSKKASLLQTAASS